MTPGTMYVLLPVHNRRALTEGFIRCLTQQTDQDFHLVLIDDGSTDATAEMVASAIPTATIIRGSGSWWWAGSLQRGREWLLRRGVAPDDLVLIANDDTTFGPEFLARARGFMATAPATLLLAAPRSSEGGPIPAGGVRINWATLRLEPVDDPAAADCVPTRGLFLRATEFLELGAFHTMLLPHYLSDYEFTLRASRRGFRLMSDPSVWLEKNELATGIRQRDLTSVGAYLRSVLTIKATKNPVYWSSFVLLASPRRYLVQNLFRIWRRFAGGLLRAARLRPVPNP